MTERIDSAPNAQNADPLEPGAPRPLDAWPFAAARMLGRTARFFTKDGPAWIGIGSHPPPEPDAHGPAGPEPVPADLDGEIAGPIRELAALVRAHAPTYDRLADHARFWVLVAALHARRPTTLLRVAEGTGPGGTDDPQSSPQPTVEPPPSGEPT